MKSVGKYLLLFVCVIAFLAYLYLLFYADGGYVLGAEGAYYLDAILLAKNYGHLWYNAAVGYIATSYNFVFHLIFIQWLFGSVRLVNFATIASLYVLPFIAVYLLCLELKLKPHLALLFSIFYLTNPFTAYFLLSINQWNMIASYLLPAFFFIILKFYERPILLFIIFGFHSLLFAFGNANPPTMVIYQITIVLMVIITSIYKNKKISIRDMAAHYLVVLGSFILFNFWWIINWFHAISEANADYSATFALGWLRNIADGVPSLWRSFSLSALLPFPRYQEQDFFTAFYGNTFSEVIFLLPIILVVLSLFRKEANKLHLKLLGLFLVVTGLLAKGIRPPFGSIYEAVVIYVPLFKIFKTAPEKWGVLFVFLLTVYLIFAIREVGKSRFQELAILSLTLYCLFTAIPFASGNFLPEYTYQGRLLVSKHFYYKPEYLELKETLNADPIQYRVLSLPGHLNYQVALKLGNDKYYGGGDPVLTNTNKPFIARYNNLFAPNFNILFDNISSPAHDKLLSLYNIKKIVINKDLYPWFGFGEKETVGEMEKIFDSRFKSTKNEVIDLFDVGDSFTPRLYFADKVTKTELTRDELLKLLESPEVSYRPAIYLTDKKRPNPFVPDESIKLTIPKLTFKKINPAKYKLYVKDASGPFLLVFSENFNHDWQIYFSKNQIKPGGEAVGNYFKGSITELKSDNAFFDPRFFETWGSKSIADDRHGIVNGYANSWLIDPKTVGLPDDFELILDYRPQRIFIFGAVVTLLTLLLSLITVYILIKNRAKS